MGYPQSEYIGIAEDTREERVENLPYKPDTDNSYKDLLRVEPFKNNPSSPIKLLDLNYCTQAGLALIAYQNQSFVVFVDDRGITEIKTFTNNPDKTLILGEKVSDQKREEIVSLMKEVGLSHEEYIIVKDSEKYEGYDQAYNVINFHLPKGISGKMKKVYAENLFGAKVVE